MLPEPEILTEQLNNVFMNTNLSLSHRVGLQETRTSHHASVETQWIRTLCPEIVWLLEKNLVL